jgi:hypothetical protein
LYPTIQLGFAVQAGRDEIKTGIINECVVIDSPAEARLNVTLPVQQLAIASHAGRKVIKPRARGQKLLRSEPDIGVVPSGHCRRRDERCLGMNYYRNDGVDPDRSGQNKHGQERETAFLSFTGTITMPQNYHQEKP